MKGLGLGFKVYRVQGSPYSGELACFAVQVRKFYGWLSK